MPLQENYEVLKHVLEAANEEPTSEPEEDDAAAPRAKRNNPAKTQVWARVRAYGGMHFGWHVDGCV